MTAEMKKDYYIVENHEVIHHLWDIVDGFDQAWSKALDDIGGLTAEQKDDLDERVVDGGMDSGAAALDVLKEMVRRDECTITAKELINLEGISRVRDIAYSEAFYAHAVESDD